MINRHKNFKDITGHKFNKLLVISFDCVKKSYAYWNCVCDCGNKCVVNGSVLRNGTKKSCGCAYKEMGQRMVLPNNGYPKNIVYNRYVQRCKKENKTLAIEKNRFLELIINPCFYCDIDYTIRVKTQYGEFKCNGLDRIDNQTGYFENNVLTCCKYCNAIRMHVLTVDETKKVIDFIKNQRNTKSSPWLTTRDLDLSNHVESY